MPRTQKKVRTLSQQKSVPIAEENDSRGEVLTLHEAAAYLRLPQEDVRRLVEEQGLPARQLGEEWRFLKSALQAWLSMPQPTNDKEGIWSAAGSWKDDPYLEDMLKDIYRKRSESKTEG